jgi:hypothetical protein
MNHHIHKIIRETDIWCDLNHFGDDFYEVRWEERFAEQIINECIEIVNSHRSKMDSGPTYIIQSIKEHFGV